MASEPSVFCDECGTAAEGRPPYFLALVFHDQSRDLGAAVARYEAALRGSGLPDIPFHMEPLMYGKRAYAGLGVADRSRLLGRFHAFAARCPVRLKTLRYEDGSSVAGRALPARLERDVRDLVVRHLGFFQSFDLVKVYYDGGQADVSRALRRAFEDSLAQGVALFKEGVRYEDYRLSQVADLACGVAHLEYKFDRGLQTATDLRFVNDRRDLRKRFSRGLARLDMDGA